MERDGHRRHPLEVGHHLEETAQNSLPGEVVAGVDRFRLTLEQQVAWVEILVEVERVPYEVAMENLAAEVA